MNDVIDTKFKLDRKLKNLIEGEWVDSKNKLKLPTLTLMKLSLQFLRWESNKLKLQLMRFITINQL